MNTTTPTPTPTPETDALAVVCYGEGGIETSYGFRAVPIENCRQLERERDEAREEAINKTESIQLAANRIDELKQRSEHWCDMHTIAAIERDEARDQLEAMREAIKDGYEALDWATSNMNPPFAWEPFKKANAALAKLQPFIL